ncbi:MAG: hypothetical protein ACM33B_08215 [Pseudomonadota bacterium]
MRRALVITLVLSLVLPAIAAARMVAPGDGSLVVRSGDGNVRLIDFKGAILGRISNGTLVVVDPKGGDCDALLVWDADDQWPRVRTIDDDKVLECVFKTTSGMRFRLVGGPNTIRINARGIALSAVGQGLAYLRGSRLIDDDGTYSVDGSDWRSLPEDGRFVRVGELP